MPTTIEEPPTEIEAEAARQKAEQAAAAAAAEKAALEQAERKRIAAEQAAARKAAQAPDREKLAAFAGQVRELKVPEAKTEAGRAVAAEVAAKWIEGQASNL